MGRLRAWRDAIKYAVFVDTAVFISVILNVAVMGYAYVAGDYGLFTMSGFLALCLTSLGLGLACFIYSFTGLSFTMCSVLAFLPLFITVFTAFSTRSWLFAGVPFWVRTAGISLGFAGIVLGLTGWVWLGKELGLIKEEKENE